MEDFDKICRTCLTENADFKSLFIEQYVNEERLRLSEILTACTSIEVIENDTLPKQVCTQCEHNILNTFSFQQQCHKSDVVLKAVASESEQSRLIELKPLENLEESSLQFSEILGNRTLEEGSSVHDQVDDFIGLDDSIHKTIIDNELGTNLVPDKDKAARNFVAIYNEEEGDSGQYSFEIASEERHLKPDYHIDQEDLKIDPESLKCEEEEETLQPLFPCEVEDCCACFTTHRDLKDHRKTHLPKQNYCKICNKNFSSASTLSRHTTSKHQPEKKSHLCSECGKGFARSDDLNRHIRVHTGERPFGCEKCHKAFAQSFRLLEHMRSHSNIKNFICAICGKGFARYTSLLAHNKTHNKIKSHECKECGKRLCGPGSLSMHMKIHTGQKDFACNFCKKRFTSASNLIVHKRTHTGERPYSCMTCGKAFPDISRLNVHSRIHSGKKPYVCMYCQRGCVSSTQLKRHVRIHTQEKPYQCTICPKRFMRSEDLKNHIKFHTDERNHICLICQKGFFQKGTLKVHMRIHTGEKPYTCNICNKCFSQTGPYSTHMKTHYQTQKHIAPHQTVETKETAILPYL